MPIDLRPLTLGELLDRSFRLYRRHFWLFVGLMAVPSVLVLILNLAMLAAPEFVDVNAAPDDLAMIAQILMGAAVIFGLMIAYFVAYVVTLGATTVAVSELYLDRPATIASAYAHVRSYIGRLVLLMILIVVRLFGLFIAAMIPLFGLALALAILAGQIGTALAPFFTILGTFAAMLAIFVYSFRYSVAVPALVLEPISPNEAIRRSVFLVRDNFWRTAILVVFATVITYAAMMIFQMPFMAAAFAADPESRTAFVLHIAGSVSGAIGGAVTGPLLIVALALLYYDLRIRKEGLDLQIMMASLDQHTPPGATGVLPSTS
jgi:glycerophosphoryl diester phosphodiesterase family protein